MKYDNDVNNLECSSSDDLVAYLYDELNAADRASFETHLADCGGCTDEFAELSFARLDVYEWHRDEFAAMETPRFVIPYAVPEEKLSWLDALRGLITPQWATAGGAFALIAVVSGALFIYSIKESGDVAQGPVATDIASNKAESIPSAPLVTEQKNDEPTAVQFNEPQIVKAVAVEKKAANPTHRVVKNSPRSPNRTVRAQRTTAPRLNDFEDEDDNTLRLGDLLADVDTRD